MSHSDSDRISASELTEAKSKFDLMRQNARLLREVESLRADLNKITDRNEKLMARFVALQERAASIHRSLMTEEEKNKKMEQQLHTLKRKAAKKPQAPAAETLTENAESFLSKVMIKHNRARAHKMQYSA